MRGPLTRLRNDLLTYKCNLITCNSSTIITEIWTADWAPSHLYIFTKQKIGEAVLVANIELKRQPANEILFKFGQRIGPSKLVLV